MDQRGLLSEIEAAKTVIGEAENELQRVVADGATAPRDDEAEVGEVVRAASLTLKTAEEKLIDLEKLLALAKIDEAKTKVETAKTVISEAQTDLDRVLDQIVVAAPPQETWVTEVVESAFSKLRTAKKELVDLERSIATDKD